MGGDAFTVAITFHFPLSLVPETQWALPHFRDALAPLRDAVRAAGGDLLGHGHPRAWRQLRTVWGRLGVPSTPDPEVLDRADVLVADNTSLMYEAASLGIPVVALNAPWYRRHVEHGLRFWSHVPGEQVDEPADLERAIFRALRHPEGTAVLRRTATAEAYSHVDGLASRRAADAILEVLR